MKTKNIIITVIVAILIIIGIVLWRSQATNTPGTSNTAATTQPANETTAPNGTTDSPTTTTPTTPIPAPVAKLSYDDALALYAGRLFQFKDCVAGPPPVISPGSLSIKKSTKYMLDNRHTETHTIRVGTQSYRLSPNSFAIATAPSSRGTYNITCDGGGVAQLLVQP